MEKSLELRNKRNNYINCLENVKKTANAVANSIKTLRSTISIQSKCYVVNDQKGGSNYLNHLLEKEVSIYHDIVDNIIPDLVSKINNLAFEIVDQEQKEMLIKGGN